MSKQEFMKELESLLSDIPLEEREEALRYYDSYFEDAGKENEDKILKELGSPSKVARLIKAELMNAGNRDNRGYFTEKGYSVAEEVEDKYEIIGSKVQSSDNGQNQNADGRQNIYNQNSLGQNTFNQNTYNQDGTNANSDSYYSYNQGNYNNNSKAANKNSNKVLLILIVIFTSFIWAPFLLGAVGVAIGIIFAILGILFGFGAAGVGMIVVGIALCMSGLMQLAIRGIGALMIGGGLIVLGLGMLITLAFIMICKNVLPAVVRGIVNLFGKLFKKRRVMA